METVPNPFKSWMVVKSVANAKCEIYQSMTGTSALQDRMACQKLIGDHAKACCRVWTWTTSSRWQFLAFTLPCFHILSCLATMPHWRERNVSKGGRVDCASTAKFADLQLPVAILVPVQTLGVHRGTMENMQEQFRWTKLWTGRAYRLSHEEDASDETS